MVVSALRHDVLFYGTGHEAWDGGGGWAARGVGGGLAWAVAWQEGDVRAEPAWLCSRRWFVHAARCVGWSDVAGLLVDRVFYHGTAVGCQRSGPG